ncbi:MAG TPA: hypothetical protein VMS17_17730 [Gemmataceae bacterium]|nr:hypothetical protein [Gemmataceae bacterium]
MSDPLEDILGRHSAGGANGRKGAASKSRSRSRRVDEPAFANYRVEKIDDQDAVKIGLSVPCIAQRLAELTKGWPKRVERQLFVPGDDYRPLRLESPDALFAWIGMQLGADADNGIWWARGEDKVTQAQLHAHLRQSAQCFDAIEAAPHHPALPRTYYLHPEIRGGDGRALAQLQARFRPASDVDADLIKAVFLTLFWGGPPGQRPAFLLESEPDDPQGGRGVGKSKLAQAAAFLAGGHIDARPDKDIDKLMTRLLSPAALDRRIALLDNVKTLRFSWGDLESLITGDVVSGRALYVGEGRQPNTLVWFITLNNASLSRDMAQRCVPIRLRRPDPKPSWETETWELIDRLRWSIVGDVLAELKKPAAPLKRFSRWAAWEQAVLSRVGDPAACQEAIEDRQAAIDDDSAEADLVRTAFLEDLRRRGHTPNRDAVWIPAPAAAEIVNRATGEKHPVNRAGMYLKTLTIPELRKSDRIGVRGWAWRGLDSDPNASLEELCDVRTDVFPP